MADDSRKGSENQGTSAFGVDTIEARMRTRIRETIETIVEEELEAALGAAPGARVGETRQGYRHGTRERTLTTSLGPATFAMPRARLVSADGTTREWRSTTVARYQRRTARVDEARLGVYLAGTNTRRLKGALAPLLRGGPLSKDAVSRLIGRLRDDFETWRSRDLADEDIRYVFLDGWFPKVRIGGRRERVPVLVTLGVRGDGQRVVLDLRLAGEESAASWGEVIASLVARHLPRPVLAIVDGNSGAARGVADALARARGAALHGAQAPEPAGQGAGAAARGTDGGIPPHDLRGHGHGRRAGPDAIHEEVAAPLPRGGGEPKGGRG